MSPTPHNSPELYVAESGESLTGREARETVRQVHWKPLLRRSFDRLRAADGFSHARASAFAFALLLVEGTIAVLGFAVAFGSSGFSRTVIDVAHSAVPGPAGQLLTSAARQAQETGSSHQFTALIVGLVASLITGTTAMGQFERSCNRIYGVAEDRPSLAKYTRAFALAVTVGVVSALALMLMVLGRPIANSVDSPAVSLVWLWVRWPVAVVILVAAVTVALKFSPRRRQPALSWLFYGAVVSVALMVIASIALAVFFMVSTTFGDTYGPLAGMIGLLLWCLALSASGLFGIAITAQLESERAAPTTRLDLTRSDSSAILAR